MRPTSRAIKPVNRANMIYDTQVILPWIGTDGVGPIGSSQGPGDIAEEPRWHFVVFPDDSQIHCRDGAAIPWNTRCKGDKERGDDATAC